MANRIFRRAVKTFGVLALIAVVGIATLLGSLWLDHTRSTMLPTPTGPYKVGRTTYASTDETRLNPFAPAPNTRQELGIWMWYPAAPTPSAKTSEYLPEYWRRALEQHEGFILGKLLSRDLARIKTHSWTDADISPQQPFYPVVLLRAGSGALSTDYTSIAEDLASHGYVVVSFDAPYRTVIMPFPDGRVTTRSVRDDVERMPHAEAERFANRLVNAWVADGKFVLDKLQQLNAGDPASRFKGMLSAIDRMQNKWQRHGHSGREFTQPNHPYATDLNIFGDGSLFELLCTSRTDVGRRRLAEALLAKPSCEEAQQRKHAIQELAVNADLRDQVSLLGDFSFQETTPDTLIGWLNASPAPAAIWLRTLALISSLVLGSLLLAGFDRILPMASVAPFIAALLCVHAVTGLYFRSRVLEAATALRHLHAELGVLRSGLELLQKQNFTSPLLYDLVASLHTGRLKTLERLTGAFLDRDKEWFYLFSRALLVGTQLFWSIDQWKAKYGEAMRTWLRAWGDFEMLMALATYAHEHPENAWPEFSAQETIYDAEAMAHPLLAPDSCVRNSVCMNSDGRFFIISGSNMAGKSTLLRAVGLNAVLAYAGAPVCADRFVLSRLFVCASIAVQDSLLNGKSKFMAEIESVKQALDVAREDGPVLFLIDEILGGTNSSDRQAASEAIVKTLLEKGAIGAISTHDLALTALADKPGWKGKNAHMGSVDNLDPLNFDYRLKPGICLQSSALAIARLAGVNI